MDITADKQALRREFRARRSAYVDEMQASEAAIAFTAVPSPLRNLLTSGKTVAAYIAIGSEANPSALLDFAYQAGCQTALPHVVSRSAPMTFRQWQPGDNLDAGIFGLQQPQAEAAIIVPDVILVPLLAFDRSLNRLGQGAGHYDRALSIMDGALVIGIGWSVQEAPYLPTDPWDIPLSAILTEKEWISR